MNEAELSRVRNKEDLTRKYCLANGDTLSEAEARAKASAANETWEVFSYSVSMLKNLVANIERYTNETHGSSLISNRLKRSQYFFDLKFLLLLVTKLSGDILDELVAFNRAAQVFSDAEKNAKDAKENEDKGAGKN